MIEPPKDIKKYLARDEFIEQVFDLKGMTAYASENRIFFKKNKKFLFIDIGIGGTVRDINYAHISSIEYQSKIKRKIIITGLLVAIAGFLWQLIDTLGWALLLAGIILIIYGIWKKSISVELTVVGMTKPWPLLGGKEDLDAIFRFIGERRVTTR
ncbi:hypothetical protein ACFLUG_00990 [Chloroflexota bacterium]